MKIYYNYIILIPDIILYFCWLLLYIYIFIQDTRFQIYFSSHMGFLAHVLGTLRLINLTEEQALYEKRTKGIQKARYRPKHFLVGICNFFICTFF
jgi:hypothetical protein